MPSSEIIAFVSVVFPLADPPQIPTMTGVVDRSFAEDPLDVLLDDS